MLELFAAFLGGMTSIFLPCVLPLYPFLLRTMLESKNRYETVLRLSAFVLSLAWTYAILGFFSGALMSFLLSLFLIHLASGIGMVVAGAWMLGFFKFSIPVPRQAAKGTGLPGSVFGGAILGIIFTPCVAPVFLGVLAYCGAAGLYPPAILFTFAFGLGTSAIIIGFLGKGLARNKRLAGFMEQFYKLAAAAMLIYGTLLILDAFIPGILPTLVLPRIF